MTQLLNFDGLSKTIRDGSTERTLWESLSGSVQEGQLFAITGYSGSGKSTLLNTLSGVEQGYSGSITALGTNYNTATDKTMVSLRANAFGYIFQSFGLIEFLNVFENVALGITRRPPFSLTEPERDHILSTMERVGLASHQKKDVRNLSGGEQQRIGIARAIIGRPRILFADEPTANLDTRIGSDILKLIDEIRSETGMTVIIATHQLELINHADQHLSLGV